MDGHMGIANSLSMKIAGIDKTTNDPIGGTIREQLKEVTQLINMGLQPYTTPVLLCKVNMAP